MSLIKGKLESPADSCVLMDKVGLVQNGDYTF